MRTGTRPRRAHHRRPYTSFNAAGPMRTGTRRGRSHHRNQGRRASMRPARCGPELGGVVSYLAGLTGASMRPARCGPELAGRKPGTDSDVVASMRPARCGPELAIAARPRHPSCIGFNEAGPMRTGTRTARNSLMSRMFTAMLRAVRAIATGESVADPLEGPPRYPIVKDLAVSSATQEWRRHLSARSYSTAVGLRPCFSPKTSCMILTMRWAVRSGSTAGGGPHARLVA